jgi:hypothetical protein
MQTQSTDYFTGVRNGVTALALDWGRSKLIDVEQVRDTRNVPDNVDVREGEAGGMSVGNVLMIGAVVVLGVILLKRVL